MDRNIWRQTYSWTAGYANFVLSALWLLISMSKGLHVFDAEIISEKHTHEE